jgi:hypothetical protein
MSVGTADLHTAIQTHWDASGLNDIFKALWNITSDPAVDPDNFTVLNNELAPAKQPFPYCVFDTEKPLVKVRMTGDSGTKREVKTVPLTFRIFTDKVVGDVRSPKQIAAYLAEEVLAVFGGHPTRASTEMELTHGGVLPSQFGNDYSIRDENLYKWIWVIEYNLLLDIPVAI